MTMFAFTPAQFDAAQAMPASHATHLVVFSVMVAIFAAFVSFNYVELIRRHDKLSGYMPWQLVGAVAMGAGVWAMHFTGMLSYQLPVDVDYHLGLTLASMLPAVLAGYVTLQVIARRVFTWPAVLFGGVLMGLGIGLMHYIGMGAMVLDATRLYKPSWFALSILVAVLMATLALAIRPLLTPYLRSRALLNLTSSVIMGLAIASMHYVAMHATVFIPLPEGASTGAAGTLLDSQALVFIAVLVAMGIIAISTVAVFMRKRLLVAEVDSQNAEATAQALQSRFQTIAERVPGMVYEFRRGADGHLSFPYTSEAVRDIYGITPRQAKQDANVLLGIIHADDLEMVFNSIERSAKSLTPWQVEYRINHPKNGELRWLMGNAVPALEKDGAVSWSGVITDITEQKKHNEVVNKLAYYDALTELPNRRLLYRKLQGLIDESRLHPQYALVCFIDVDNFKRLNDTQGRAAGDNLLRKISQRAAQCFPKQTVLGRLSSDEFIALVPGLGDQYEAAMHNTQRLAEQVLNALGQVYDIGGHDFDCALSIGMCLFDDASADADELIKRADIAMQEAKQEVGNQWRLFDPEMEARVQHRYQLEHGLRLALQKGELSLNLQPQVNGAGQCIGAEALLRWQHPQFGWVSPGSFIPVAEETGLIMPIGDWVLQQACARLQQWQQHAEWRHLQLSVNVSARQFYQPDFVQRLIALVKSAQINPQKLVLELTESLVLEDIPEAIKRMQALKKSGFLFSMDDFGTGYSSLSYLALLPFNEVKIDQSFIRSIQNESGREWIIIEAILSLADKLAMTVVAEGVETPVQYEALRVRGCQVFQGYHFSKPLTAADFTHFMEQQNL